MKIERNKNPAGRLNNIAFGLCCIGDGLVRVLSLGFLHSSLTLDHARETALSFDLAVTEHEEKP